MYHNQGAVPLPVGNPQQFAAAQLGVPASMPGAHRNKAGLLLRRDADRTDKIESSFDFMHGTLGMAVAGRQ